MGQTGKGYSKALIQNKLKVCILAIQDVTCQILAYLLSDCCGPTIHSLDPGWSPRFAGFRCNFLECWQNWCLT